MCVGFQRSNVVDGRVSLVFVVTVDASAHNCAGTWGNGGNTAVNEPVVNHAGRK